MDLAEITPLILTRDEAANIGRSLQGLAWAKRVVVVDSGSEDETAQIVNSHPNAQLYVRKFDSHAAQWNFGLTETAIDTEWVLALDADYHLNDAFFAELRALSPSVGNDAYRASFIYCVDGIDLRASLYPQVTLLFRRRTAKYVQDGHTQRLVHTGTAGELISRIRHDDRKGLGHWLVAQSRYMQLEADKLRRSRWADLDWIDRLRLLRVVAPPAVFLYCLIVRGLILDGRAGIYYAMQRAMAEAILSLTLLREDIGRRAGRK